MWKGEVGIGVRGSERGAKRYGAGEVGAVGLEIARWY